tara:strand:- start:613 stop:2121 length:1509 start_codon:yes stop_codon:yes gene_type:complete
MNILKNNSTPDILDCIADLSNDEIFTSPKLANNILDTLPKDLWSNPDTKFLDPTCKTGVFLREIAKRLNNGLKQKIKDHKKRTNHIFTKQIFGISITEITSLMSRRTLYYSKWASKEKSACRSFQSDEGNIFYKNYQHKWNKKNICEQCGAKKNNLNRDVSKESYAYPFLHDIGIFKNMKFDVIIGNPPYQLEDGGFGKSASPIYHKFVEHAIRLNPTYLTMIIPARWYSGGKGLDEFRGKMLNDKRIKEIHDFPETADCFPGQNIRGGVCYFLWDKNHNGKTKVVNYKNSIIVSDLTRDLKSGGKEIFIRYNKAIDILKKVQDHKEESFDQIVSSRKPFGLPTNFSGFKNTQSSTYDIMLYRFGDNGYINSNQVETNRDLINKFKVIVPYASPGGDEFPHQVLSNPLISPPKTCSTETYLVIGPYKDKATCENIKNYMRTKFCRFLILLIKNTQHVTKKTYSFVPMQNFKENWDDKKLYKKYKITSKEIDFINSLIKPMNE